MGAASLAVLGQTVVLAATAPLPGGGSVTVTLDEPVAGVVPYGTDVPLSGSARADGTAVPTADTALVYTIDVSGSTTQGVTGGSAACGDQDGLSPVGSILDCEIASLVNLNTEAIGTPSIARVGAVAFGGYVTYNGAANQGLNDAITGDLSPAAGLTPLTTPTADLDPSPGPDVVTVLRSADNGASLVGFRRFTPLSAPSGNTNYQAAVLESVDTARVSTLPRRLVVLVSDGAPTRGITGIPGTTTANLGGGTSGGVFPNRSAFESWVASSSSGVRFITFAIGNTATCAGTQAPTQPTLGSLQSIADATGGTCTLITDPADLPDVLPQVVQTTLQGVDATVDGAPTGVTSSATFPVAAGTDVPFSTTVSGLAPGLHALCGRATGQDAGGTATARECRTVDVAGLTLPPTVGGTADDVEGSATPVSAQLNGGSTFAGWTAEPLVADPGASCSFAEPSQADTTVTCTDDGSFLLRAASLPADSRATRLTVANAAPVLMTPAFTSAGPVFAGSEVEVVARFSDAGGNDSHTCRVDIGAGPVLGTVSEPVAGGQGLCVASVTVSDPGSYTATMTVTDDEGASDSESTAAGSELQVVELVIEGGDQPGGGFAGTEGTALHPTVSVPAGTSLLWTVSPIVPLDAGATCDLTEETTASPTLVCDDDASLRLRLSAELDGERREAVLPVTVQNVAPVLSIPAFDTSGPVLPGTPVVVSAPFTDAGANDSHTCEAVWNDGVTTPGAVLPDGTCRSQRALPAALDAFSASLTVTDDDGGSDSRSTTEAADGGTITVTSVEIDEAPGGVGHSTTEGTPIGLSVTAPAGADLSWTAEPVAPFDAGADCLVQDASSATPTISCDDDGSFLVTVTATIGGRSQSASAPLTVLNAAPVISAASLSPALTPIGSAVTLTSSYADAGTNDTHSCVVDWGDGTAPQPGTASAGSCTATRPAATAGVSVVTVTVTDDDGGADTATTDYLVVYDPAGGFVTGGGHVPVPAGSLVTDPSASGRGTFGFVSKYKKGATTPTGNTEFQFHAGNLSFESAAYEWLVVSGAKAQYRGTGSVNGQSGYSFLVTAVDGQARGSGSGTDAFRIRIWDSTGTVFDNQQGTSEDFSSSTGQALSGGSIVIHSGK